MKLAIVTVKDTEIDMMPWCDVNNTDEQLLILLDNNKVYSIDRDGVECKIYDINRFAKVIEGINNSTIPVKMILNTLPKTLSQLDIFLSNNSNVMFMLETIKNMTEASYVHMSSMLGIDKPLAKALINEYLIPNGMMTRYHSTFKVYNENKVTIVAAMKKLNLGDDNE